MAHSLPEFEGFGSGSSRWAGSSPLTHLLEGQARSNMLKTQSGISMTASKPLAAAQSTLSFDLSLHASTTIAAVGALLAAGTAQAGIVYGGDTPTPYTTIPGTEVYSGSTLKVVSGGPSLIVGGADKADQLTGSPFNFFYSASPLSAGAVFGPAQVGTAGTIVTPVGSTNYYGFAENIAGPSSPLSDWRYGWIQIDTVLNTFTYAYDDVAGTPIAIGAKTGAVPEPAGLALLATGLAGLVTTRRRRRSVT